MRPDGDPRAGQHSIGTAGSGGAQQRAFRFAVTLGPDETRLLERLAEGEPVGQLDPAMQIAAGNLQALGCAHRRTGLLEITDEGRRLWQTSRSRGLAAALDDALRSDPALRSAVELDLERRMNGHREPDGTYACDAHVMAGYALDALLADERPQQGAPPPPPAAIVVDAPRAARAHPVPPPAAGTVAAWRRAI